jgi:UDP-GlcNAc:undecaprenyl-phosphate/decaprenyl-phosphate GlcNAc-1-phosphate transferase
MEFDLSIKTALELAIRIAFSAISALLLGPVAIFMAKKLGAIDTPGSAAHKQHSAPTPLAGGLVLFMVLPILAAIFHLWNESGTSWLLAATGVIFIFGLIDDTHGLSAPQKFVGQFIAAGMVILSGTSIQFLEYFHLALAPWLIATFGWMITLLWLVGMSNAFNLIDSMDGLVAGLAAISAGFFTLTCLASGQSELAQMAAILFGLSLGLYFYNNSPARFFLGDSGAQVLGFLLAAIGILYTPPNMPQGSTWFLPILVLGVPIFDTTLVVVSRIRRRKPIFQADLAHTYHRLVQLGLHPGQAVLTIQITALLLCSIAFIAMSLAPLIASLLFLIVVLAGVGLIIFFERTVKIEP